jgi:RHS repeat-associated protein
VEGQLVLVTPLVGGTVTASGDTTVSTSSVAKFLFPGGKTRAFGFTLKPDSSGVITFTSTAAADIALDVTGWFSDSGGVNGAVYRAFQVRALDTRFPTGLCPTAPQCVAPAVGGTLTAKIADVAGAPAYVPSDAVAVKVLITAVYENGNGGLLIGPAGTGFGTPAVYYEQGVLVSAVTTVKLGVNGQIALSPLFATSHFVIDVLGYYSNATAGPVLNVPPTVPAGANPDPRLLIDDQQVADGETVAVRVAGYGGVPTGGVSSVLVAVSVKNGGVSSWAATWASGTPAPLFSSLLWAGGEQTTQTLTVPVGPDGRINLYTYASAKFAMRVLGWFATPLVNPVTYTYDKNGSRVTETDTATSVVTSYGWDPLDRLTSVTKGLAGGGTAQTLFTDTPATVNTTNWHAWWPPAATPFAGGGVTFNTNGERNAISGLSLTAGNYEIEFVGPDNAAVSVAPYVQGHQNWTNYVEPFEKIGAQGQLAAKPWTGIKKWAMTIPAGPNGLASSHLDVRIVGTGSFTVTSMVLRRVALPATVNVYDADGQRLVRKDPSGQLTVFLDGQEIVLNTGSATVVSAARYYSGSTLLAQRSTTGGLSYMGTDHQGTVTATLTTGGVVSRQRYKPYGAQRGSSNVLPSERGFIGQIEDTSTGLSYLNARHYDTATATFLSRDPVVANAQYGYADSSPIVLSDATGLDPHHSAEEDECSYYGRCKPKPVKAPVPTNPAPITTAPTPITTQPPPEPAQPQPQAPIVDESKWKTVDDITVSFYAVLDLRGQPDDYEYRALMSTVPASCLASSPLAVLGCTDPYTYYPSLPCPSGVACISRASESGFVGSKVWFIDSRVAIDLFAGQLGIVTFSAAVDVVSLSITILSSIPGRGRGPGSLADPESYGMPSAPVPASVHILVQRRKRG